MSRSERNRRHQLARYRRELRREHGSTEGASAEKQTAPDPALEESRKAIGLPLTGIETRRRGEALRAFRSVMTSDVDEDP
jgi:hypothetical protein